jgi:hypothetical protein
MGLSICVGALADLMHADEEGAEWLREQLASVNDVLRTHGLPAHEEPETPIAPTRAGVDGFPYSWIHILRRAYAHSVVRPSKALRPLALDEDGSGDSEVSQLAHRGTTHLICHSDAEGLYVPVDFERVLIAESLPGSALGSTQRLMLELVRVAPALGITLTARELSDAEAEAINAELDTQPPFFRERTVWLALYEAARLPLEHGAAIVFQ